MSMLSSGVSASGPASATKASSAPAGRSARSAPSPSAGTGCSGSMWSRWSPGAGIVPKVSSSGPSARSGRISSASTTAPPRQAASTIAQARPRMNSGISGRDGSRRIRPMEVTSSGTVSVHWRQVWRTSAVRSIGKNSAPAYSSGTGYSIISIAVTTPTLPPPPLTAQNRSGSWSASARTSRVVGARQASSPGSIPPPWPTTRAAAVGHGRHDACSDAPMGLRDRGEAAAAAEQLGVGAVGGAAGATARDGRPRRAHTLTAAPRCRPLAVFRDRCNCRTHLGRWANRWGPPNVR
jgi:hypothetical protein